MAAVTEQQILFGISPPGPDGVSLMIFGVTAEAWRHMSGGKTHNVDFTKIGLPFQVVMYGAPDHAAAKKMIDGFVSKRGGTSVDKRNEDFAVPNLSPDDLERLADGEEAEARRLLAMARQRRRGARNIRAGRLPDEG